MRRESGAIPGNSSCYVLHGRFLYLIAVIMWTRVAPAPTYKVQFFAIRMTCLPRRRNSIHLAGVNIISYQLWGGCIAGKIALRSGSDVSGITPVMQGKSATPFRLVLSAKALHDHPAADS
jgi:hypothetical protein